MEETHQITIRVPKTIWLRFKSAVVMDSTTVRQVIEDFMTEYIRRDNDDGN